MTDGGPNRSMAAARIDVGVWLNRVAMGFLNSSIAVATRRVERTRAYIAPAASRTVAKLCVSKLHRDHGTGSAHTVRWSSAQVSGGIRWIRNCYGESLLSRRLWSRLACGSRWTSGGADVCVNGSARNTSERSGTLAA